MKTNLQEVAERYTTMLEEMLNEINLEEHEVSITTKVNDKKSDKGLGSVKIEVNVDKKAVRGVLFVIEKEKADNVLFINSNTNDIVFNNFSPEAVTKAEKFVMRYFENSLKRMLGMFDDAK